MANIDDVARMAGVSTATVSRALRGLPGVAEVTRLRVAEAAATLGYVASPSASRLAGGRTGAVGVVVPWITRWFFATVVESAEQALHAAGWDLLLYNLGGDPAGRRVFDTHSLTKRVDAVMLVSVPLSTADSEALAQLTMPGVTVSAGSPVPGWPRIRIDDVAAARTATEHLLDLGHTRIAHLSGDSTDRLAHTTHRDRRAGYLSALADRGRGADPGLDIETQFTVDGGARATRELIRRPEPPTAIFAACDEMAMGAIRALREARLRVPEDVSVIGIDDHDLAAVLGLTTVAQPAAEQGRKAAATVLDSLFGIQPAADRDVLLPTALVVRESTGPPPGLPSPGVPPRPPKQGGGLHDRIASERAG
jgi:LacI family transcriptional regulator, repressor for deo operon, udp, cdd, tsx, nupC, and nupG